MTGHEQVQPGVVSHHDVVVAVLSIQLGLMAVCAVVGLFAVVRMLGGRR